MGTCGRKCTCNTWHDRGLGLKTLLGVLRGSQGYLDWVFLADLGWPKESSIFGSSMLHLLCHLHEWNTVRSCATGWSGCMLFQFPASFQILGNWNRNPLRQCTLLMYMSCKWERNLKFQGFRENTLLLNNPEVPWAMIEKTWNDIGWCSEMTNLWAPKSNTKTPISGHWNRRKRDKRADPPASSQLKNQWPIIVTKSDRNPKSFADLDGQAWLRPWRSDAFFFCSKWVCQAQVGKGPYRNHPKP